jgi:hypothetical protein
MPEKAGIQQVLRRPPGRRPFILEKANRKDAKAQRLAKTMHYKEPAILPSGEPPVPDFLCVTWRLCAFAVMNCSF